MGFLSRLNRVGDFLTPERVSALGTFGEALSEPGTPGARLGRTAQTLTEGLQFSRAQKALRGALVPQPAAVGTPLAGQVPSADGAPSEIAPVRLSTAADAALALRETFDEVDFGGIGPEKSLALTNMFLGELQRLDQADLAERRFGFEQDRFAVTRPNIESVTELNRRALADRRTPEQIDIAERSRAEQQSALDTTRAIEVLKARAQLDPGTAGPTSVETTGKLNSLMDDILVSARRGINITPDMLLLNSNAHAEMVSQLAGNIKATLDAVRATTDPVLMKQLEDFAEARIASVRENPIKIFGRDVNEPGTEEGLTDEQFEAEIAAVSEEIKTRTKADAQREVFNSLGAGGQLGAQ